MMVRGGAKARILQKRKRIDKFKTVTVTATFSSAAGAGSSLGFEDEHAVNIHTIIRTARLKANNFLILISI